MFQLRVGVAPVLSIGVVGTKAPWHGLLLKAVAAHSDGKSNFQSGMRGLLWPAEKD